MSLDFFTTRHGGIIFPRPDLESVHFGDYFKLHEHEPATLRKKYILKSESRILKEFLSFSQVILALNYSKEESRITSQTLRYICL